MRDFLDEKYWNKKQMEFFAAGASGVHQRPLIGGNQTGKTTAVAAEFSWHADGLYPSLVARQGREIERQFVQRRERKVSVKNCAQIVAICSANTAMLSRLMAMNC